MERAAGDQRPDPVTLLKVARWRTAEDQLFSGLLHDPQRYERCVVLMAALNARLQARCPTRDLALAVDPGLAAAEAASESGVDVAGLDLDLVGAAALANHWWRLGLEDGQGTADEQANTSLDGQW